MSDEAGEMERGFNWADVHTIRRLDPWKCGQNKEVEVGLHGGKVKKWKCQRWKQSQPLDCRMRHKSWDISYTRGKLGMEFHTYSTECLKNKYVILWKSLSNHRMVSYKEKGLRFSDTVRIWYLPKFKHFIYTPNYKQVLGLL